MEIPEPAEALQKAKATALRLLKLRPRSTREVEDRLRQKGHPEDIVRAVVDELIAAGLLDDEAFAKAWMQSRLNKPWGLRKVSLELVDKGISKEVIKSHWDEVKDSYDELEIVRELAQKRYKFYKNVHPLKRKKRVMDYLARRGFGFDVIMKAIREL